MIQPGRFRWALETRPGGAPAWRTCTRCRDGPDDEGSRGHCTTIEALRNDPAASNTTDRKERIR